MTDDQTHMPDIMTMPSYTASLQLASGPVARVTVVGTEIRLGFYERDGRTVDAVLQDDEAAEIGSMMFAASRVVGRA